MDDRENLFYRPNLKPDRDYRSDGIIPERIADIEVESNTIQTPAEKVQSLIEDYQEVLEVARNFLPGELPAVIEGPLETLIERIEMMVQNNEIPLDTPEYEIYDPQLDEKLPDITPILEDIDEYISIDPDLPDMFPKPTDIEITVKKPKSLADIARETYKQDMIDLKEDYLKKLQTVMQGYLQEMVMIMAETGVGKIEDLTRPYDGDAVTVPSKMQHLSDYIVRSQIVREQKVNLFKKTHNIDQTLMHMRALHAAEKQRERYYECAYGDSETYLNTHANSILRESRAEADKKYNQTLYDMYKYLNASVMIIDDTLNMSKKESQAKGSLLKSGVNIYITKDIKAAMDATSTATDAKK